VTTIEGVNGHFNLARTHGRAQVLRLGRKSTIKYIVRLLLGMELVFMPIVE